MDFVRVSEIKQHDRILYIKDKTNVIKGTPVEVIEIKRSIMDNEIKYVFVAAKPNGVVIEISGNPDEYFVVC